jgi:hypothetical protein
MTYNEEELLANIQQILTDFDFEPTLDASKQSILNKLNAVLFPLKDGGAIADYQFVVKNTESADQIDLTVCVKASEDAEAEGWDFTITNGNN